MAVENFKKIKTFVKDVLVSDQKLVSLGGDHSVSWPILDAHLDIWGTLDILHIDAHPDFMIVYWVINSVMHHLLLE